MAVPVRTKRELIRSRVKAARDFQRTMRRHSGVPSYGYRPIPHPSGQGSALDVDPDEAKLVRRMVDEIRSGATSYAVAKGLNAEAIRPRKAEKWTAATVGRISRTFIPTSATR